MVADREIRAQKGKTEMRIKGAQKGTDKDRGKQEVIKKDKTKMIMSIVRNAKYAEKQILTRHRNSFHWTGMCKLQFKKVN